MPLDRLRVRVTVLAVTLALALLALPGGAARADVPTPDSTPIFLGWPSLLPPLPTWFTPTEAAECADGDQSCVVPTIARMQDQFAGQLATCNHRAVFTLAYLRTTQQYQVAAATPGFFQDTPWVNTEDAVFASYYFEALSNWSGGDTADVPGAWQVAFSSADGKKVSALGDLLLGMNAHINRDLPYVLASMGLVAPDGTSRKADHDKVNVFLNQVVNPLLIEEAQRFDPLINDLNSPEGITWTALMQILEEWREAAWRNAELLVNAPNATARQVVANTIETTATTEAHVLATAYGYLPPLITTAARDRYCAAQLPSGS